jgi:hypothetical protein
MVKWKWKGTLNIPLVVPLVTTGLELSGDTKKKEQAPRWKKGKRFGKKARPFRGSKAELKHLKYLEDHANR